MMAVSSSRVFGAGRMLRRAGFGRCEVSPNGQTLVYWMGADGALDLGFGRRILISGQHKTNVTLV